MNGNASDDHHTTHHGHPIRHALRRLREGEDGIAIPAPERPAQGLEPRETLGEWLRFVKGAEHELHEVKEYFGQKSSFGISDLHF